MTRRQTFTAPGAELRRFQGHEGAVSGVTVLADGGRVLSKVLRPDAAAVGLETGADIARLTLDASVTVVPSQGDFHVSDRVSPFSSSGPAAGEL